MVAESRSAEETFAMGEFMAKKLKPWMVLCLNGDLGVGKTVFVKGIARGLGIKEPVVSPTFTILQEYKDVQIPLYHFDVYRIEDEEENVKGLLPKDAVSITIEKDPEQGLSYRRITIE